MHKAILAERILEMVTSSSRAASIVGDLLEEASNRSALWFWLRLLKIFSSHVLQDFRSHWLRMTWLAFSGVLMFYAFPLFLLILFFMVVMFTNGVDPNDYGQPLRFALSLPFYFIPILAGRNMAKRSHGCEVAAGLALAFLLWILTIFLSLTSTNPNKMDAVQAAMWGSLGCVIIVAVALLYRYRSNTRARKLRHKDPESDFERLPT